MRLHTRLTILTLAASVVAAAAQPVTLHVIPNTHGTVSGWLVDFDTERNYVLNNYLAHLDRVKADDTYRFAWSEAPNLINLMQFAPERLPELKQRLAEKRVELVNGFFLEPDINLSGGEALLQAGVLGLKWYEQVFGFRPRHAWMIDITGGHRQMPQMVSGLGMESVFFNRNNPTQSGAFWWASPDGSRTLALVSGHYMELGGKNSLFTSKEPLTDDAFQAIAKIIEAKRAYQPGKAVLFSLAGAEDYSLPPARESYPAEFLREWTRRYPDTNIRFSIPSDYVDALLEEVKAGKTKLQDYSGDTGYAWDSFWMNMPEVKQYYRKDEHLLQAAETLATVASLKAGFTYPAQTFYDSWINMLMNMDRNTLWGAAAGVVFKDVEHWDAWDRFSSVEEASTATSSAALRELAGEGDAVALFNPLNWKRDDPLLVSLPARRGLAGATCETLSPDGRAICAAQLPPVGVRPFALTETAPPRLAPTKSAQVIETQFYLASVDATGALVSLKLKPAGTELLGGPANVLIAEVMAGTGNSAEHFMASRPKRRQLDLASEDCAAPPRRAFEDNFPAGVRVSSGRLATVVQTTSAFCGDSRIERTITFYRDHPRIDFDTRLDLRKENVLVAVDFPLAGDPVERTRGIPYGYSSTDPRQGGNAILPSVRWSNYQLPGGAGVALLDRGLAAHELNGRTVTLALVNAVSQYMKKPNDILRGQSGARAASYVRFFKEYSYALVPHAGSWQDADIARKAWEFNAPPVMVTGAANTSTEPMIETSDNIIVEAIRRVGRNIEIRLVESKGLAGAADITIRLPHRGAALTNMMGEKPQPLAGGPSYKFPLRPQQIVTLRLGAPSAVASPVVVRDWSSLAPLVKREALKQRLLEKGHPGR
ncbi:MAG: hypothetical protein IT168_02350 [Bryobacterales bacterium]|nr:hypothetical protein [Bryobacterales bacterium]